MMKYSIALFAAPVAMLALFFMSYDIEAARAEEKARIEALTASAEYQAEKAAHFARWERLGAARDAR